jgi:hypothetical protein
MLRVVLYLIWRQGKEKEEGRCVCVCVCTCRCTQPNKTTKFPHLRDGSGGDGLGVKGVKHLLQGLPKSGLHGLAREGKRVRGREAVEHGQGVAELLLRVLFEKTITVSTSAVPEPQPPYTTYYKRTGKMSGRAEAHWPHLMKAAPAREMAQASMRYQYGLRKDSLTKASTAVTMAAEKR